MRQIETPGYRHEALFYRGDEEFLAGTFPLVREAVDADAAVLVAVPEAPRGACSRRRSAATARASTSPTWRSSAATPGRIIGAWRDFVRTHAGGDTAPLGIGEPIWPERSEAELVECQRHETLLNLAFTPETPWTLLCPYDAAAAPARGARRRPPQPPARPRARQLAPQRGVRAGDPGLEPLPAPAVEPTRRATLRPTATLGSCASSSPPARSARGFAARASPTSCSLSTSWPPTPCATRAARACCASGARTARCSSRSPTTGTSPTRSPAATSPPPTEIGGRGLYLVNQLCDLVQLRSSPEGSVIRIHMHLG